MQKPRFIVIVAGAAIIASASFPSAAFAQPGASTHPSAVNTVSAKGLLQRLAVKKEVHATTYAGSKFTSWIDADGDGENTRAEVLKAESTKKVVETGTHVVQRGQWRSPYDGVTVESASKLTIDHLVPLKEAWVSGAAAWTSAKRSAYANDVAYAASLIAVSAHAARAKGAKEPSAYLPATRSYRCSYVKSYIAVKARWHLAVDSAEKRSLRNDLSTYCAALAVSKPGTPNIAALTGARSSAVPPKTIAPSPVVTSSPLPGGSSSPVPTVVPAPPSAPVPTVAPTVVPTTPIPTPVPMPMPLPSATSSAPSAYYANCDAVRAAGKAPLYAGQPGYRAALDRDGDGVACEN